MARINDVRHYKYDRFYDPTSPNSIWIATSICDGVTFVDPLTYKELKKLMSELDVCDFDGLYSVEFPGSHLNWPPPLFWRARDNGKTTITSIRSIERGPKGNDITIETIDLDNTKLVSETVLVTEAINFLQTRVFKVDSRDGLTGVFFHKKDGNAKLGLFALFLRSLGYLGTGE